MAQSADGLYKAGVMADKAGNATLAFTYYEKAANMGDSNAQFALGVCYDIGRGVEKDESQAANWVEKAAKQGHRDAQYMLSYFYRNGIGVPKDDKQAVYWKKKYEENPNK